MGSLTSGGWFPVVAIFPYVGALFLISGAGAGLSVRVRFETGAETSGTGIFTSEDGLEFGAPPSASVEDELFVVLPIRGAITSSGRNGSDARGAEAGPCGIFGC